MKVNVIFKTVKLGKIENVFIVDRNLSSKTYYRNIFVARQQAEKDFGIRNFVEIEV